MKTIILWIVVLQFYQICQSSDVFFEASSTRRHRVKRSIRQRAFSRACKVHTCVNLKCNNDDGWYLYGSDWGCCGNYDGCCTWASTVCYYHDAMCKCCDYGWLICGPDCKPEAECFDEYEENTNQINSQTQNKDTTERHEEFKDKSNDKYEAKKKVFSQIVHAKKTKNDALPLTNVELFSKSNAYDSKKVFWKRTKSGRYLKQPTNISENKTTMYGRVYNKRLQKLIYTDEQLMAADQPLKDMIEEGSGDVP